MIMPSSGISFYWIVMEASVNVTKLSHDFFKWILPSFYDPAVGLVGLPRARRDYLINWNGLLY